MANKPAVIGTTTFTYEPEIHHLVVRSVPNAIVHHGRSTIFVQAQDVDSNDVEFPWPETPVRLFYTDTTYGRLRLDEVVSATAVRSVPAPSEPNIQQKSVEAVLRDEVMKRLTQRHPELQKRMVSKSNKQGFSQKVSLMHTVGPLFLETTYADANVGKIIYEASGEAPTADQMIALTAIQYFTGFIGGVPQYQVSLNVVTPVATLIDTLITLTNQSHQQNLIGNSHFAHDLVKKLDEAKKHLTKKHADVKDSIKCAKEVRRFQKKIDEVYNETKKKEKEDKKEKRKEKFVTVEGWKFLYYNAQYILDRLPALKKEEEEEDE